MMTGFSSFYKHFLENQFCVMQSDFAVKNHKIGRGNMYLIESRSGRNEMWCAADNLNFMSRIITKGFLDLNFTQLVIVKISQNCPKFHIFHKNGNL